LDWLVGASSSDDLAPLGLGIFPVVLPSYWLKNWSFLSPGDPLMVASIPPRAWPAVSEFFLIKTATPLHFADSETWPRSEFQSLCPCCFSTAKPASAQRFRFSSSSQPLYFVHHWAPFLAITRCVWWICWVVGIANLALGIVWRKCSAGVSNQKSYHPAYNNTPCQGRKELGLDICLDYLGEQCMNCTSTLEYAFFRLLICLGSHWELDLMFSSDCDIVVVLMACNSLASRDGALAFENFQYFNLRL
jgi:hypothetical protein